MKTEFLSEMFIMKSLVEDSVLNGAKCELRLVAPPIIMPLKTQPKKN
jgi:hypothetical protein